MLCLLRSHPRKLKSLFIHDPLSVLPAEKMITLFAQKFWIQDLANVFIEHDLMQNWNEFLQDVANEIVSTTCIREYGSTLYVGMTREKNGAKLNAYISFTLKRRLKLSSKPHEATKGLFCLVQD